MGGNMVSDAELAAFIVLGGSVLAYSVGATVHVLIDYIHGKRLLRQYWTATDAKIAAIETQVVTSLTAKLTDVGKAPAADSVASGMESYFRSESGLQWARELAGKMAHDFEAQVQNRMDSARGVAARKGQSDLY